MTSLPTINHQVVLQNLQDILLYPQNWKLVSSLIPSDVTPVLEPKDQAWHQQHTESHANQEILIPLSGTCSYGFNNRVYPCEPGFIFLLNANEPHDFTYPSSANNLIHLWLHMLGKHTAIQMIEIHHGKHKHLPRSAVRQGLNESGLFFLNVWRECAKNPQWPESLIRLKITSALGALAGDIIKAELPVKPKQQDRAIQEQVISEICHHISITAGCGVSLDLLAKTAGYNKFHLSRLFQAKAGCTIHQYVDLCRVKWVKDWLSKGYSKKSISAKLGFASPSTFSRWLKRNPLETEPLPAEAGRFGEVS